MSACWTECWFHQSDYSGPLRLRLYALGWTFGLERCMVHGIGHVPDEYAVQCLFPGSPIDNMILRSFEFNCQEGAQRSYMVRLHTIDLAQCDLLSEAFFASDSGPAKVTTFLAAIFYMSESFAQSRKVRQATTRLDPIHRQLLFLYRTKRKHPSLKDIYRHQMSTLMESKKHQIQT